MLDKILQVIGCWLGVSHVPNGPPTPHNAGGRHCLRCSRIECISIYDGRSWHRNPCTGRLARTAELNGWRKR